MVRKHLTKVLAIIVAGCMSLSPLSVSASSVSGDVGGGGQGGMSSTNH